MLNIFKTSFIFFSDSGVKSLIIFTIRKYLKLECHLHRNIAMKKYTFNDFLVYIFSFYSVFWLEINLISVENIPDLSYDTLQFVGDCILT